MKIRESYWYVPYNRKHSCVEINKSLLFLIVMIVIATVKAFSPCGLLIIKALCIALSYFNSIDVTKPPTLCYLTNQVFLLSFETQHFCNELKNSRWPKSLIGTYERCTCFHRVSCAKKKKSDFLNFFISYFIFLDFLLLFFLRIIFAKKFIK